MTQTIDLRPIKFKMLRATAPARPTSVDLGKKVISGYVVAEVGPFKSGRGAFDLDSLNQIVKLMLAAPDGIKVRYGHPDGTTAQTLDSFIGWARNPRLDGELVRADLHLSEVSFLAAAGSVSRGEYLMTRAQLEPASLGSSLELDADIYYELDSRGLPLLDQNGELLPPIWMPTIIVASDIVDDGDAVHGGLLSRSQTDTMDAVRESARKRLAAALGQQNEDQKVRREYRNRQMLDAAKRKK